MKLPLSTEYMVDGPWGFLTQYPTATSMSSLWNLPLLKTETLVQVRANLGNLDMWYPSYRCTHPYRLKLPVSLQDTSRQTITYSEPPKHSFLTRQQQYAPVKNVHSSRSLSYVVVQSLFNRMSSDLNNKSFNLESPASRVHLASFDGILHVWGNRPLKHPLAITSHSSVVLRHTRT